MAARSGGPRCAPADRRGAAELIQCGRLKRTILECRAGGTEVDDGQMFRVGDRLGRLDPGEIDVLEADILGRDEQSAGGDAHHRPDSRLTAHGLTGLQLPTGSDERFAGGQNERRGSVWVSRRRRGFDEAGWSCSVM